MKYPQYAWKFALPDCDIDDATMRRNVEETVEAYVKGSERP